MDEPPQLRIESSAEQRKKALVLLGQRWSEGGLSQKITLYMLPRLSFATPLILSGF
jgi:hypothetical protein